MQTLSVLRQVFLLTAMAFALWSDAQNTGIGTTTPNSRLDIRASNVATPSNQDGILIPRVNAFPLTNPTASQDGMMIYLSVTASANPPGFYYWENASSSWKAVGDGWKLTGNAFTSPAVNFLGTTDNTDLVFKRNNLRAALLNVDNTSWGVQALNPLSTGNSNTANGYKSLFMNTSGYANTSTGTQSLYTNTTGKNNTANGTLSLYTNNGDNNTATGTQSLYYNNTGSNNTASGYIALHYNNTGSNNTAGGVEALLNNDAGNNNTAIGVDALQSNGSGSANTAMGIAALKSNSTHSFLVAIGDSALYNNDNGAASATQAVQNTAVGSKALYSNVTGAGNTALGFRAMYDNDGGNNNTAIGSNANLISNSLTNATTIGANAKVGCNNCMVLGDTTSNVKIGIGTGYPTTAKLVIKTTAGSNGIDLSSSDAYAEMRHIRNTLNAGDHDLYFNFLVPNPSSLHMYSNGSETMTVKNNSVGIGNTSPAASAALEINSTAKGFLPPRMTYTQRDAIASPATGLMIWCTNCGVYGQGQVYNGTVWTNLVGGDKDPALGESFKGGKVFYILQPGDPGYVAGPAHGLIGSLSDLGTAEWGCTGVTIGGTSANIGTGAANTNLITAGCITSGIAARICNNLVTGGYSDWYLPSENDLIKLAINRAYVGGFDNTNYYWSSTETGPGLASTVHFATNAVTGAGKSLNIFLVRAIRSF